MEDTIRSVVSTAVRLCREKGIQADESLIAYMACLLDASQAIQSTAQNIKLADALEASQVLQVAERVVQSLAQRNVTELSAVKLQIGMEMICQHHRKLVTSELNAKQEKIEMLGRAVADTRTAQGVAGHERLLGRVLEYVAVAGGMELALQDDTAKEEVRLAIESVFPLSTLVRFVTLPADDKLLQVESLAKITTGICLFNQTLGRGGAALPAGAASYTPQANRLLRDIHEQVETLSTDVATYAALLHISSPNASTDPSTAQLCKQAKAESLHKAAALVQWEALRDDLLAGLAAVTSLDKELQHLLLQVHDSVGTASAVPRETVLPCFERLGAIHQALCDELRMLVVRQRLADELTALSCGYVTLLAQLAKARRPGRKTGLEQELESRAAQRLAYTPQSPVPLAAGCEWVPAPRQSSHMQQDPADDTEIGTAPHTPPFSQHTPCTVRLPTGVALNGFDPVLLGTQGTLERCHPGIGCLRYKGQLYGFSSPETMATFGKDPGAALNGVHSAVMSRPCLAVILGITSNFAILDLPRIVHAVSQPLKVDFGCQTPTHFVEKHIDNTYEWNEWALRRRALSLANLRQKCTHGTQTGLSHFKRDTESQVWVPRAAAVQTRVNKGQTMPRKLQFVTGLRGSPATKMNVVRLELDLGQPHQH